MDRRGFGSVLVRHLGGAFGSVLLVPMPAFAVMRTQQRKLRKFRIKYQEKPKGSVHTITVQGYNEDDAKHRLRRRHPEAVFLSVDEIP